MAETLGALVRQLRKRAGLTQFQLAERAGLGESTVRRIETDRSFDHRLGTINRIADAVDASPEDRRRLSALGGGTGPEAPEAPAPPPERLPPPRDHGPLTDAAEELARESRQRWRREEARHRVHHPFALPVRWQQVPAGTADQSANALLLAPGEARSEPDLSGDLRRVAEIYQRIPSGRLVVLGSAGSGKSILAVRFALDLLDARTRNERVPVIFSLGSWDPTAVALRDWLIARLLRDYPHLARRVPSGKTLAADLLDDDLVLPVLDGFDELAEGLRAAALETINLSRLPLVLTSRHAEFTAAVRTAHAPLAAAVVLELRDLDLDDLRGYLPRTDPAFPGPADTDVRGATWEAVLDPARTAESAGRANLAAALRTPLMIALARTMYSDHPERRPGELLDTDRFPDPDAIEEHLLAGFVPAVYRPRPTERLDTAHRRPGSWDAERAERWLGHLADHLTQVGREQQDLTWWEIGTSMGRTPRALIIAFLAGLAFGVTTAVGNVPVDLVATTHGPRFAVVRGLVVGLLHGSVAGALFGLVYWYACARATLRPSPVRLRLSAGTLRTRRNALTRFLIGLGCGAAGMALLILVDEGLVTPLGLADGQGAGLTAGLLFVPPIALATGLVFALIALFEAPVRTESVVSPADLLHIERRNVVFHLLTWALVIGLCVGLLNGIVYGPVRGFEVGLVFGLEAAFGAGLSYGLSLTAWGQWVALARIWLPLTGQLPWALITFLEDAHHRGVLRQVGAVYQFRHAWIQSHLSRSHQQRHGSEQRLRDHSTEGAR
ncbi:transcriptional regulator with XRE-family HTH domain [Kitasatospora gansuensis]|uniref:Transcriptional regulator with XRE-family HTH domain n=1 Tax=Kitasatospora gansuensis TaxID=258050 RepID=A0A7W7WM03_9ACTN|nr:helix-turn-helix transcriptional regulator [Kitasatospora gansuensis]MBB4951284.1 transcriptional regulator with XRE-family HTH domain [Kitasatospora gansuensis]